MKTVHKFSLKNCLANSPTPQEIWMPIEAEILRIEVQGNAPEMWAFIETENMEEARRFIIYGTGVSLDQLDEGYSILTHRGTFFMQNFVWHVFEVA